nr:uncharacterized protein LOC129382534 [Dermacentor andersoni]
MKQKICDLFREASSREIAAKKKLSTRIQTYTESYLSYIKDVLSLWRKAYSGMPEYHKSGKWHTISEVLEEIYHVYMAHSAYGVLEDTYYAVQPKHHQSYVLICIAAFLFNIIFLGLPPTFFRATSSTSEVINLRRRHILSQLLPLKLIYLLDMLLHVCYLASDAVLVVALLRCSPESLALAKHETLWGGRCHVGSMILGLVSIVYQLSKLTTYYQRLAVTTSEQPPLYISACLFWLREALRAAFERAANPPSTAPLGEEFELERTMRAEQVCSASFELRYRPAEIGATKRITAQASASAMLREDYSDD